MSLWAEYKKEREDVKCLESKRGFIAYKIVNDECFITDMYVQPEYRKQGEGRRLADNLSHMAKDLGCKSLTATVAVGTNNDTESLKVQLAYGMKLLGLSDKLILLYKDL